MARQKHSVDLELLARIREVGGKQALAEWNTQNPQPFEGCLRPNLEGADLTGADFTDADCSLVSFCRATLREACFVGAKLQHALLIDVDATNANFEGACLREIPCPNTSFQGAILKAADFSGSYLGDAVLDGTNLEGARFFNAMMNDRTRWDGATGLGSVIGWDTIRFSDSPES